MEQNRGVNKRERQRRHREEQANRQGRADMSGTMGRLQNTKWSRQLRLLLHLSIHSRKVSLEQGEGRSKEHSVW